MATESLRQVRRALDEAWLELFGAQPPKFSIDLQKEGFDGDFVADLPARGVECGGGDGGDPVRLGAVLVERIRLTAWRAVPTPTGLVVLTAVDPASFVDDEVSLRSILAAGKGDAGRGDGFRVIIVPPPELVPEELMPFGYHRMLALGFLYQALLLARGVESELRAGEQVLARTTAATSVASFIGTLGPLMNSLRLGNDKEPSFGRSFGAILESAAAETNGRCLAFAAQGLIPKSDYRALAIDHFGPGTGNRLVNCTRDWLLPSGGDVPDPVPWRKLTERTDGLGALLLLLASSRFPRSLDLSASLFRERDNLPWYLTTMAARLESGAYDPPEVRETARLLGAIEEAVVSTVRSGVVTPLINHLEALLASLRPGLDLPRARSNAYYPDLPLKRKIVSGSRVLLSDIIALCST